MSPMHIKLLTLRDSATRGGSDDTPLVDFVRDKEVIAFREHFYVVNEVPHLSCVVPYQDAVVPLEALEAARRIRARDSTSQSVRCSTPSASGARSWPTRRASRPT